jgi:inner membrane protein
VAVGLLLARAYPARSPGERRLVAAGAAGLALLPDADVLGLVLGLDDGTLWGHRGYSHSLLFAAVIAAGVSWLAPRWGASRWPATLLAVAAVTSHGLLDALTFDSRGIPFFWPLDETRVAFPWRVIPPAPHGIAFLSQRGLEVAAVELVYFAPVMTLALGPARLAGWLRLAGAHPRSGALARLGVAAVVVAVSLGVGHQVLGRSPLLLAMRDGGAHVRQVAEGVQPPLERTAAGGSPP